MAIWGVVRVRRLIPLKTGIPEDRLALSGGVVILEGAQRPKNPLGHSAAFVTWNFEFP